MKSVSFQSTQWFQCAFELSFFFLISDVTYFTVICYEDGKFPVIAPLVSCVPLSYLCFFMICDYTVIYYEARTFSVIDTMVLLSYLSILMISDLTYSTVICYEVGMFPGINTMVSVPLSFLSSF